MIQFIFENGVLINYNKNYPISSKHISNLSNGLVMMLNPKKNSLDIEITTDDDIIQKKISYHISHKQNLEQCYYLLIPEVLKEYFFKMIGDFFINSFNKFALSMDNNGLSELLLIYDLEKQNTQKIDLSPELKKGVLVEFYEQEEYSSLFQMLHSEIISYCKNHDIEEFLPFFKMNEELLNQSMPKFNNCDDLESILESSQKSDLSLCIQDILKILAHGKHKFTKIVD